jgi:hypothetical protein
MVRQRYASDEHMEFVSRCEIENPSALLPFYSRVLHRIIQRKFNQASWV